MSVALAELPAKDHGAAGRRFVAAPVFGRPEATATGALFVIAAGAESPFFDAIGQRTFVISEAPRAADLVKLNGNFLVASGSSCSARRWRWSRREASTDTGTLRS